MAPTLTWTPFKHWLGMGTELTLAVGTRTFTRRFGGLLSDEEYRELRNAHSLWAHADQIEDDHPESTLAERCIVIGRLFPEADHLLPI